MVVIEGARYHVAGFMQITYPTIIAYMLPWDALVALIFLAAAIRTKSRRWRICFGSYLAALALLLTTEATKLSLLRNAIHVLSVPAALLGAVGSLCLVVAAIKDFLDRHRTGYPWTHWTGVVLALLKLAWVVRGLVSVYT